jgi:hypothetical protein
MAARGLEIQKDEAKTGLPTIVEILGEVKPKVHFWAEPGKRAPLKGLARAQARRFLRKA